MKKLLFLFFLLPVLSQAQIIGSSLDSASAVVQTTNQMLSLNLQPDDNASPGKKQFVDEANNVKLIFRTGDKEEIKSVSFIGPAVTTDKMMNEYLLPLAKQNADFQSKDMWAKFNKLLLVCRPDGTHSGVAMKSISLEKDNWEH